MTYECWSCNQCFFTFSRSSVCACLNQVLPAAPADEEVKVARWKSLPHRLVHVILGKLMEGREETLQRLPPCEKVRVLLFGIDASDQEQLPYMETTEGRSFPALGFACATRLELRYIASLPTQPRKAHSVAGDRVRKGPTCCFRAAFVRVRGPAAGDPRLGPRGRIEN